MVTFFYWLVSKLFVSLLQTLRPRPRGRSRHSRDGWPPPWTSGWPRCPLSWRPRQGWTLRAGAATTCPPARPGPGVGGRTVRGTLRSTSSCPQVDIFFSLLKSCDFWSVLMADLLCIFLPLVDIFCPLRRSPLGCGVAQKVVRRLAARQVRVRIPVSRHGMAPQGGPLLSGEQWGNKSVPYSRRMDVWMNVL